MFESIYFLIVIFHEKGFTISYGLRQLVARRFGGVWELFVQQKVSQGWTSL